MSSLLSMGTVFHEYQDWPIDLVELERCWPRPKSFRFCPVSVPVVDYFVTFASIIPQMAQFLPEYSRLPLLWFPLHLSRTGTAMQGTESSADLAWTLVDESCPWHHAASWLGKSEMLSWFPTFRVSIRTDLIWEAAESQGTLAWSQAFQALTHWDSDFGTSFLTSLCLRVLVSNKGIIMVPPANAYCENKMKCFRSSASDWDICNYNT